MELREYYKTWDYFETGESQSAKGVMETVLCRDVMIASFLFSMVFLKWTVQSEALSVLFFVWDCDLLHLIAMVVKIRMVNTDTV